MKATGIVRRIDELGRVVIPKEIRRVQHIRSGDSLEIFMEENGEVVFKKYSPLAELGEPAAVYADVLARRLGCGVLVCDREHIVAAAGAGKNELLHRELPPELDRLLKKRRLYTAPANPDRRIRLGGRCAAARQRPGPAARGRGHPRGGHRCGISGAVDGGVRGRAL